MADDLCTAVNIKCYSKLQYLNNMKCIYRNSRELARHTFSHRFNRIAHEVTVFKKIRSLSRIYTFFKPNNKIALKILKCLVGPYWGINQSRDHWADVNVCIILNIDIFICVQSSNKQKCIENKISLKCFYNKVKKDRNKGNPLEKCTNDQKVNKHIK